MQIKAVIGDHVAAGLYALKWGCAISTLITPYGMMTGYFSDRTPLIAALFAFGLGWYVLHNTLCYCAANPGRTYTPLTLATFILPALTIRLGFSQISDHYLLVGCAYFTYSYGAVSYAGRVNVHRRNHTNGTRQSSTDTSVDELRTIVFIEPDRRLDRR